MWSFLRYARPLVQAAFSSRVNVAGAYLRIPGPLSIRLAVVAGNIRMHRLMDALIVPGATVIDVGANIGYDTVYAARRVGPAGRVVAIEPAMDNLAVLRQNVTDNRLQNVSIAGVAAGGTRETRRLYLRGEVSAVNSFFPESCYAAVSDVAEVPVVPLDELVTGDVDVVKIDVEGAELEVLSGMSCLLGSPRVALIVEWHPWLQEAAGHPADALPRRLLDHGFRVRAVWHTHTEDLRADEIAAVAERLRRARRPVELVAQR